MFSRRPKFSLLGAFVATCFILIFLHDYRYRIPEDGLRKYLTRPGGAVVPSPLRPPSPSKSQAPSWLPPEKQQTGVVAAADTIPKKLWFKLGPKGLDEKTRKWSASCTEANPHYKATFLDDAAADKFVVDNFGTSHPDIVELFLGLTVPIFKADIFRYLLLFVEGGIYCDLDVSCSTPIDEWIPAEHKDKAAVVAGWEFDVGWGDNFIRQFATWTIMARPASPHMWAAVDDTLKDMREVMRAGGLASPAELTVAMLGNVIDVTGPRRFTTSVLASLARAGVATSSAGMRPYEELEQPKMLGDVLIQPSWAFAASSNKYPEDYEVPRPLVVHHYAGSWKNAKGGEIA